MCLTLIIELKVAGMVSEIFEYPFDLAKVRLQSQLLTPASDTRVRFKGPMDCLVQTWKDEGFRGLYRVCDDFIRLEFLLTAA